MSCIEIVFYSKELPVSQQEWFQIIYWNLYSKKVKAMTRLNMDSIYIDSIEDSCNLQ